MRNRQRKQRLNSQVVPTASPRWMLKQEIQPVIMCLTKMHAELQRLDPMLMPRLIFSASTRGKLNPLRLLSATRMGLKIRSIAASAFTMISALTVLLATLKSTCMFSNWGISHTEPGPGLCRYSLFRHFCSRSEGTPWRYRQGGNFDRFHPQVSCGI